MKLCHEHSTSGHFSTDRTPDPIKQSFFWPNIHHDVSSSIQCRGIRTFFSPSDIFGLGGIRTFWTQSQERKLDKDYELYQLFMSQTVLIFPNIYIIHKKELKHFGL